MPTVTLLAKKYEDLQDEHFDKALRAMLEGLKVKVEICGVTGRGWIQASISGEDETVALHYLSDRIGICPESFENISKFANKKGCIVALSKKGDALHVDIGVFRPRIADASISLQNLQAQLTDGRKVAMEKITELFGFCDSLPLTVKILNVDKERNIIEAQLAEEQLALYGKWTGSLLDRLLIVGATIEEVKIALQKANFSRDIIGVEPLGIFEHAVVCKFGTDAVGLIPKIGKALRKARFSIFRPTKILPFFPTKVTATFS